MNEPKPLRPPDKFDLWAKCWNITEHRQRTGEVQRTHLVESWIVHAPQSHPVWPWHLITGQRIPPAPEYQMVPGATHELGIYALDPRFYPPPLEGGALSLMHPHDALFQFSTMTDAIMRRLVLRCVDWIADGTLVPHERWFPFWAEHVTNAFKAFATEAGIIPSVPVNVPKGGNRALN